MKCFVFSCALVASLLSASSSRAAAIFNFSGGNGAQLSVTIPAPITYNVTTAGVGPTFIIDGIIDPLDGSYLSFTFGPVSYSVNGGPGTTINAMSSGVNANDMTSDDFYFGVISDATALSPGDVVTVSAGTFTSTTSINGPAPASGWHETFIASNQAIRLSANAVPEPASLSLLALASLGLVRRRRGD